MATDHHHAVSDSNRLRLGVVFIITALIVVAQFIGSLLTGSLALLTDTAHAFVDATGLMVALIAATLMRRPATNRRTWGFLRLEVLAALAQATLLIGVGIYAAIEGIRRLFEPPEVPPVELFIFGVIGLAANIIGIMVLASGRDSNLNLRAAFLEVVNDALGSVGVIVAAVLIWTTGFQAADSIAGLIIVLLIVPRAFLILKQAVSVLMETTPPSLDLDRLRAHLRDVDHVVEVHDVHASEIATGFTALTAHLVVDDECFRDGHAANVIRDAQQCASEHFDSPHVTFQLEPRTLREQTCFTDCSIDEVLS
ncbi:MAG: cation diffusion facilitator family transporter [Canibacter sp.]